MSGIRTTESHLEIGGKCISDSDHNNKGRGHIQSVRYYLEFLVLER